MCPIDVISNTWTCVADLFIIFVVSNIRLSRDVKKKDVKNCSLKFTIEDKK